MREIKCQCPEEGKVPERRYYLYSEKEKSGMNHKPNKCEGTNEIRLYQRENKKLYLCSCCNLVSDILLESLK